MTFEHDPELQRFRQVNGATTKLYLGATGAPTERISSSADGVVTWSNYLAAGGQLIGIYVERIENVAAVVETGYFHPDHLGSVAVITNETGAVVERLSFDPSKRSLASPRRGNQSQASRRCRWHRSFLRASGTTQPDHERFLARAPSARRPRGAGRGRLT